MSKNKTVSVEWFKTWGAGLTLIALVAIYYALYESANPVCQGIINVITDLIAVVIAYLVIYLIFIRKGFSFERQLDEHTEIMEEKLNSIEKLMKTMNDNIEKLDKRILSLEGRLSPLQNKVDRIEKDLNSLTRYAQNAFEISRIINGQNRRIRGLFDRSVKSHPFASSYYKNVMRNYHNFFSIKKDGFYIDDEFFSLTIYRQFWEYLLTEQRKRFLTEGSTPLLVRMVHSASVDIWTNKHDKYKGFTKSIMKIQKEFKEYGGISVRILLGPGEERSEKYVNAMALMDENGVEPKYLKQSELHKMKYDFAFLADEQVSLMWYSDNYGLLVGTLIKDTVELEMATKWIDLRDELVKKNDAIKTIPEKRRL